MWQLRNTGQTGGTPGADIDATLAWDVSVGSSNVVIGVHRHRVRLQPPGSRRQHLDEPGRDPGERHRRRRQRLRRRRPRLRLLQQRRRSVRRPRPRHPHLRHHRRGGEQRHRRGRRQLERQDHVHQVPRLGRVGHDRRRHPAVDYAIQMGVDLTSNSWGGGGFSQALYDAIAAAGAHEMAFVAAAGNHSTQHRHVAPTIPSAYDLANIIAVAATDNNDALASFSNYGATTVDLAAPGVDILSTLPGASYGTLSGTSMATPHVAGRPRPDAGAEPEPPRGADEGEAAGLGGQGEYPSEPRRAGRQVCQRGPAQRVAHHRASPTSPRPARSPISRRWTRAPTRWR